jgi:hypothetical protein
MEFTTLQNLPQCLGIIAKHPAKMSSSKVGAQFDSGDIGLL